MQLRVLIFLTAAIHYPSGFHSVLRGSQEIRDQFPRGSVATFL